MEAVLLVARLVLVGAFVLAGTAKWLDRRGTRAALGDFGVPTELVRPAAVVLPSVELACALGLLVGGALAWWASIGAGALLALFSAGIAQAMRRGRRFDCRCFGSFLPAPIGWRLLARNAGLLAAAGLVIWSGPQAAGGVLAWDVARPPGELAMLLGVAALAVLLVVLQWRQRSTGAVGPSPARGALASMGPRLLPRLERPVGGLPVGTRAPAFSLPGERGRSVSLEGLLHAGRPALLLFVDPGCAACRPLWPDLRRWQDALAPGAPLEVISFGPAEAMAEHFPPDDRPSLLADVDGGVARAYAIQGNPSAVLVGADGAIARETAEGAEAVRTLIERLLDRAAVAPA